MSSTSLPNSAMADSVSLMTIAPAGTYRLVRRVENLLYVSGQGPKMPDGTFLKGRVGVDVSVDEAYQHARLVGRLLLSTLADAGYDLDRLEAVKLLGMVNAPPEFAEHPAVINGCSDYLVERMGERGQHARSAVGMGSLPNNMTVEIEAIFRCLDPATDPLVKRNAP